VGVPNSQGRVGERGATPDRPNQQGWCMLPQSHGRGAMTRNEALSRLGALLGILGDGCTLIPKALDRGFHGIQSLSSAGEPKTTIDAVSLQEDLWRYADDMTTTVVRASMKREKDGAPIPRKDLLTIWVTVVSAVVKTAAGPNGVGINRLIVVRCFVIPAKAGLHCFWMPDQVRHDKSTMRLFIT
jgi:hypothetical protein